MALEYRDRLGRTIQAISNPLETLKHPSDSDSLSFGKIDVQSTFDPLN
jgi:hypothetical protein